jgi:hypothetical protein
MHLPTHSLIFAAGCERLFGGWAGRARCDTMMATITKQSMVGKGSMGQSQHETVMREQFSFELVRARSPAAAPRRAHTSAPCWLRASACLPRSGAWRGRGAAP